MRGLPTPIGSPFTLPFTPPTGIRKLPFELLRDDRDPRRRVAMQEAFAYYNELMSGQRQPVGPLMPQAMLFQHNKRGVFDRTPYDSTAVGFSRMVGGFSSGVLTRVARVLPKPYMQQAHAAARQYGGMALPQPSRGAPEIINRAVRTNNEQGTMAGRYQPPAGGIRSVNDLATTIPMAANSRLQAAFAQTFNVLRK